MADHKHPKAVAYTMNTLSESASGPDSSPGSRLSPWGRVVAAWFLCLVGLALAGRIGVSAQSMFELSSRTQVFIQALIMSGIVLGGLWWMLKNIDHSTWSAIAVGSGRAAVLKFLLGFGLFWGPVILVLLMMELFDWGSVTLDLSGGMLWLVALSIFNVAVFEAIPEELAFRGYIYHNLARMKKRWVAALLTIPLFLALPLLLVPVQSYLLGMEVSLGGAAGITGGYVVMMTIFGAFTIYLRILSGSVWTTVGFHLAFVLINHLIGPDPGNFIHISEITPNAPLQPIAMLLVALMLAGLIAWPWLAKSPIGWRMRDGGGVTA